MTFEPEAKEKKYAIFAVGIVILWVLFWAAVVFIAWHFLNKYW